MNIELPSLFSFEETSQITVVEFLRGFLGSITLGLIGTIPWILVSMTGFFVGIFGFVIVLGAYYGFGIAAQKMHKSAYLVMVLVIILAIPFSELVSLIIEMIDIGIAVNMDNISAVLSFSEVQENMIGSVLMGYLIAFLGASSFLGRIRQPA